MTKVEWLILFGGMTLGAQIMNLVWMVTLKRARRYR